MYEEISKHGRTHRVHGGCKCPLKDYSIRKSLPLACATWCITATPISTQNRRIIALRKPPTKSYATSRKADFVALCGTSIKHTKKGFGFYTESFFAYKIFINADILLTFYDAYAIIGKIP